MKENIKNKIKKISEKPGVYFFYSRSGEILYIGKSISLRSRIRSYFLRTNACSERIKRMIPQIDKIETQETDSVLEALILEANLIKKHKPKYNVREKDDKSFSYFVITKEKFPRVLTFRKTELNKILPNSSSGNVSVKQCRAHCSDKKTRRRSAGKQINIDKVYGPYTSKRQMQTALRIIRRIFPFHSLKYETEEKCFDFQIGMCPGPYAHKITKADYNKNIQKIKMILEGKKESLIVKMEKEMKNASEKEEFEKALEIRNKIHSLRYIQDTALLSKSEDNESENYNHRIARIEGYDISNIQGQMATGAMVVFENGKSNKSEYRRFKIKSLKIADDVHMMEETLIRRFGNNWKKPDLILLDGGKGHLNMARKILANLNLNIPIVAAAKGVTRKKLKLYSANFRKKEVSNLLQDSKFIGQIMDEVHRFAISYHRKLRRKWLNQKDGMRTKTSTI